ncbi:MULTISPECIES: glycosyl hydrolase family 57 [Trichocoleus]|uniref:Glycosyl hydrolase family 57 n=1 Tax=Trichocoleus desertorum GB2-A4 TaxID=2933944 RepID=A0ABV0J5D4_9CYAN|nr:glycosyl hydrolase family 57 [Trichocoleus sp. FACHB-46]MBD1861697.1 glycosyl hydrolase family 57 [Trichocoleus sp. FACHB-46]
MPALSQAASLPLLPELIDGLPNISGWEAEVRSVVQHDRPIFLPTTNIHLQDVSAAFAIALHMHQPMIPAGPQGELISNLQYMFEHPYEGDNHNAGPFAYCYSRIADFMIDLVRQGCNPRIMLDYSGTLLWGLRQMGRGDILDNLKRITCDRTYHPYVEWLGTFWGHALASTTPIPDLKLHIQAWQHHFAAIFGWDALARVKGFSLPEMHLPNHPDTLFELVKALKEAGYRWLLLQADTVETTTGQPLSQLHLPHQLVARNAEGETVSITALIKTQGADNQLVGQMQPYQKARTLNPQLVGQVMIPPLVAQMGDGENSGIMMNEFPSTFRNAWYDMSAQNQGHFGVVGLTGTEYLELIEAAGCTPEDYPVCQAKGQHRIWQRVSEADTPKAIARAITELKREDSSFQVEGVSSAHALRWSQGNDPVLASMQKLSALFHQTLDPLLQAQSSNGEANPHTNPLSSALTQQPRYRQALLYNLLIQTSCFNYWGQGMWTDYARTLYSRGKESISSHF